MMIINDKFSDSSAGVIGYNDEIYFAYQDYQGSILAIADDNGSILEEYSYDAWGNRRDVTTLENYYSPGGGQGIWAGFFHRGYTGHEHLECFGLINMNGRLYDPLLGRMLSPDKYVQAPDFSQNFNRYSYAWNNPLTYTDPSGDFIETILIGAFIGAAVGATANVAYQGANGNIESFRDYAEAFLKGAGVGAIAGAVVAATAVGGIAMAGKSATLSKVGGKKLVSSMVSGTVNTLNSYDPARGIGWHTLGHFGAGALGGSIAGAGGLANLASGMLISGLSNMAVNMADQGFNKDLRGSEEDFYYSMFQSFASGALSVVVGTGFGKVKPNFLKGKKWYSYAYKSLWYGGQGMAADFAYSSRSNYSERSGWGHLGIFAAGAIGGIGQDLLANKLSIGAEKWWATAINNGLEYGGGTGIALTTDMTLTFLSKGNGDGFYRPGREVKTGYLIYKTLLYTGFHRN
ncbi:MAG: RHS repeat-associated core domain-containing protein [Cryomorphaceae bacterium]|nr:RHS repeat-associated core domain-containing protein [Cryomorphaceae bacterium]